MNYLDMTINWLNDIVNHFSIRELMIYILYGFIASLVIIYFYIRAKYKFWAIQPVFHVYDYGYMLKAPGIIDHYLPQPNRYTNFKNIKTYSSTNLSQFNRQKFVNLIKTNYLQNKENVFSPKEENIFPYLSAHNDKTFVSLYSAIEVKMNVKKGKIIEDETVVGSITSRPIYVTINNGDPNAKFPAYYVDYLCVDILHRKKNIAPQLIQTHHYNQRHSNKNVSISIFKREDQLTGIVPICVYYTYGYSVTRWTQPKNLSAEYNIISIGTQNFQYLHDFLKSTYDKFQIVISIQITNLLELIKTKNVFVYVILCDDNIISAYFFRKSCVYIEKDLEVLSCFASINDTDNNIFIQGFKISFWKIAYENNFGFAAIENISNNDILIENINEKTEPIINSPTAYYFYNFAYPTFKSNKCLIIN